MMTMRSPAAWSFWRVVKTLGNISFQAFGSKPASGVLARHPSKSNPISKTRNSTEKDQWEREQHHDQSSTVARTGNRSCWLGVVVVPNEHRVIHTGPVCRERHSDAILLDDISGGTEGCGLPYSTTKSRLAFRGDASRSGHSRTHIGLVGLALDRGNNFVLCVVSSARDGGRWFRFRGGSCLGGSGRLARRHGLM
jgi:hypothetical protein